MQSFTLKISVLVRKTLLWNCWCYSFITSSERTDLLRSLGRIPSSSSCKWSLFLFPYRDQRDIRLISLFIKRPSKLLKLRLRTHLRRLTDRTARLYHSPLFLFHFFIEGCLNLRTLNRLQALSTNKYFSQFSAWWATLSWLVKWLSIFLHT